MKKANFIVIVALGLVMIGCASQPAGQSQNLSGVPDFVNKAYLNASEDVLIGLGTYKVGNNTSLVSQGKTVAETRARADISRQLNSLVKNMVEDTTVSNELDPGAAISFSAQVTQALSKSNLSGTRTIEMQIQDGIVWLVMEYSKSAAMREVSFNANDAARRLAIPSAVNNLFQEKMDAAFSKEAAGGPNTSIIE